MNAYSLAWGTDVCCIDCSRGLIRSGANSETRLVSETRTRVSKRCGTNAEINAMANDPRKRKRPGGSVKIIRWPYPTNARRIPISSVL